MERIGTPGSVTSQGILSSAGGMTRHLQWQIAEEVPVAILVNSEPVTVMMATPVDLEDMAAGFLVGEGLLAKSAGIRNLLVLPTDTGFCVDVAIEGVLPAGRRAKRSLEGRTGCGLCGMTELTDVTLEVAYSERAPLSPNSVAEAFGALSEFQPINGSNHSVHAAAFATREGEILVAREDVGRHNALDKLIGTLTRKGMDTQAGFAVMSSRCSFELVQKSVYAGLGGLATLSAPTALALDMARRAGLPLACRAPGGVALFQEHHEVPING